VRLYLVDEDIWGADQFRAAIDAARTTEGEVLSPRTAVIEAFTIPLLRVDGSLRCG